MISHGCQPVVKEVNKIPRDPEGVQHETNIISIEVALHLGMFGNQLRSVVETTHLISEPERRSIFTSPVGATLW